MQSHKFLAKPNKFSFECESVKIIKQIGRVAHRGLVAEYSTSQDYFYKKIIDDLLQRKPRDAVCIRTADYRYDQQHEHFQKYYKDQETCSEFPELLQYYKYYTQDAICFVNREFAFLGRLHEKKKAALYQQLKKKLNISDSKQSIAVMEAQAEQQKVGDVLSQLNFTETSRGGNDQSYLLNSVLRKMNNYYGPSRIRPLNKIDSEYKFMNHSIVMSRAKFSIKQLPNKTKNTLESTNVSTKANQSRPISPRRMVHRRFESCDLPSRSPFQVITAKSKQYKQREPEKDTKKVGKIKRRRSVELISRPDTSTGHSSMEIYKKQTLKTQSYGKNEVTNFMEKNFKSQMEYLRGKIKEEKQKLNRKSQTSNAVRKKLKKV